MGSKWDILGIGVVAVDDLLYVAEYPGPDSKIPLLSTARQGGGLTATALVAAARLGATVAYLAHLGHDELSAYSLAELGREGVDCSPVLRTRGARPYHSYILVDRATGSRTILYSSAGVRLPEPAEVTPEMVGKCRVLLADHLAARAALRGITLAREQGIPSVVDVEDEGRPGALDLLEAADHVIIGIALANRLTGETDPAVMVQALVAGGRGRICTVVTAGERGCWYACREDGGEVRHFPGFRVRVVDTTGCGDVFHGAYAASIARNEGCVRAIRVATAAAGLKAAEPGGRSGIPDRAALERFLELHGYDQ